ncbi:Hsp20 family protein [Salinimonas marina]|uniref:Hsp20 family protein n=1 Tax=Salinimonas marina TaxID=2785918 RepID=A0A7S9DZ55_9ALTE|nr:Hsp20 family protein [Salinimonas marina]QPG06626.1 Hsp20 family protein [Salinimonas marina]
MRNIDLSPLYRSFIGSDRLASLIDAANSSDNQSTYPPYNIEVLGEDSYRISMAAAGFTQDNLTLETRENTLLVEGKLPTDNADSQATPRYLHKGISPRNFKRKFQLGDYVNVQGAELSNGLLHIDLKRVLPEAKQPQQIPIGHPNS